MAIAEIHVTLKPTLLDAQGATVLKALHQLGHEHARGVRIGKYIAVEFDDALAPAEIQAQLESACRDLLSNPVIEEYRITLPGSPASGTVGNASRATATESPSVVATDLVPRTA